MTSASEIPDIKTIPGISEACGIVLETGSDVDSYSISSASTSMTSLEYSSQGPVFDEQDKYFFMIRSGSRAFQKALLETFRKQGWKNITSSTKLKEQRKQKNEKYRTQCNGFNVNTTENYVDEDYKKGTGSSRGNSKSQQRTRVSKVDISQNEFPSHSVRYKKDERYSDKLLKRFSYQPISRLENDTKNNSAKNAIPQRKDLSRRATTVGFQVRSHKHPASALMEKKRMSLQKQPTLELMHQKEGSNSDHERSILSNKVTRKRTTSMFQLNRDKASSNFSSIGLQNDTKKNSAKSAIPQRKVLSRRATTVDFQVRSHKHPSSALMEKKRMSLQKQPTLELMHQKGGSNRDHERSISSNKVTRRRTISTFQLNRNKTSSNFTSIGLVKSIKMPSYSIPVQKAIHKEESTWQMLNEVKLDDLKIYDEILLGEKIPFLTKNRSSGVRKELQTKKDKDHKCTRLSLTAKNTKIRKKVHA